LTAAGPARLRCSEAADTASVAAVGAAAQGAVAVVAADGVKEYMT